jgi:hypothetical protein
LARIAMNREPPNLFFSQALTNPAFLELARLIYFHSRSEPTDPATGSEAVRESTFLRAL